MLGEPVFGSAADAFILILNRSVGDRVRLAERFAQHQPEFQPEPNDEPVALALATPSPSTTPSPSPSVTASPSPTPTAAPATGGGGTAGFQHASLLVIGIAAVLVGSREPRLPQKDAQEPLTRAPRPAG